MKHVFLAVGLALSVLSVTALAGTPDAAKLSSCVGQGYIALPKMRPTSTLNKGADICLSDGDMTVCRRRLPSDASDNNTMEVSVQADGVPVQRWLESSDPSYLDKVYAFRSTTAHHDIAVVATQQSETQGLGGEEWAVNVVPMATNSPGVRRTFTVAEFGPAGTLVMTHAKKSAACHLLSTRWENKKTLQGETLVLVGQLLDLNADEGPRPLDSFRRRLDRRLEQMRARRPDARPLAYFQK